jgi:predicted metal-dependent hydrolase
MFFKTKPKVLLPPSLNLSHEGREMVVRIKQSPRASRLSLRMKPAEREILLTAPPRAKLHDIEDFAMRHRGWMVERLRKLPPAMLIEPMSHIPYRGGMIKLVQSEKRGVMLVENELHVGGDLAGFKRRVHQFLMSEARREVTDASDKYAKLLGVSITEITMRDTKSRWGSCSSTGALSYSWRIIMAPPDVLEYLCAHEVSHRREMNHSPRFWAHVKSIFPEMDEANKWLKKHGNGLFAVS